MNSVADVTPDGQYLSAIKDRDRVITYVICNYLTWFLEPSFINYLEKSRKKKRTRIILIKWFAIREPILIIQRILFNFLHKMDRIVLTILKLRLTTFSHHNRQLQFTTGWLGLPTVVN